LTEIYLCGICSCQEILRRNGRGQLLLLRAEARTAKAFDQYGEMEGGLPTMPPHHPDTPAEHQPEVSQNG
jgi:hypothetical protein